ncbi:MAG: serine/threonine-protein kinase, partial [Planctomycetota bacterium]
MPEPPDLGFRLDDEAWLQQARAALEPEAWDTVGDFEILEEVSRGGQGVVLRGRSPDGTMVALKRLIAGTLTGTRGRIRFEREMEIAARLDHPGIVPLLQRAIHDRQPLLVMPWIEGVPPDRWARPQSGPSRSRREIVGQLVRLCDALSHAHQRGVIHRDLKPSNILIDAQDMPHVLDFGIGKLLLEDAEETRQLTLTTEFLGSPTYAPPERLLGSDTPSDVRDDVYSLGILLYNLLADAEPYPFGDTLASAIRAVQEQEPIPLRRHDASIERDLAAVVHKAIAKEPELRYSSVAELRADLQRFLVGDAVSAHPPSRLYRLRKTMRRNPAASVFACLSLGLILGFGAYAGWQANRLETQRNNAYSARGEAKEEAARTHDALGFLTEELLAQLDPQLRGRVASVPEILRDASADIGTRFGDDPDLEIEVRLAVGRLQLLNGDYRGAADQLESAEQRLSAARRDGFEASPTLQRELFLVSAEVHLQRAAYALSEQALEQAQELLTDSAPRIDHHRHARLRIRLAMTRGEVASAERLCRAHLDSLPNEATAERWQTDLLLVAILRSSGQAQASADLARSLIDRQLANPATASSSSITPTSPPTIALADATRAWGWSLFHAGHLTEAEAPLRQALELRQRLLGRTHSDVAQSLMDVAI